MPSSDPKSLALVIEFPEPPRPVIFTDVGLSDAPLPYETKPPTQLELSQLTRIAKKGTPVTTYGVSNSSSRCPLQYDRCRKEVSLDAQVLLEEEHAEFLVQGVALCRLASAGLHQGSSQVSLMR